MNPELEIALRGAIVQMLEPLPKETASEWCCRVGNLFIPPPGSSPGPFSLAGREYMREFIDDFSEPAITDCAAVFGSQSGKTTALMAGLAFTMIRSACAALWIMPNADLARSFSKTRWMPFVEASPALNVLIPRGAKRHDFAAMEQRLGASQLNFLGTNSPANLSSKPAPLVLLDEVDKFSTGTASEADAVNLAEQRTKDFANPKRFKVSTPTLTDGIIWQEYLKGDQRRYNVPCPDCSKMMLLVWSKQMTILKPTGRDSYVVWDREARRKDGGWDLERVKKSARAECWNCGKHIQDGHKTRMIRDGKWEATNPYASRSFRSRHLPSLYAASPQTTFGVEAVKFLEAKKSLMGLQGFINGELAEPWESQDMQSERCEIVSPPGAEPLAGKTFSLIGADYQLTGAAVPWVCRDVIHGGHSRLKAFGFAESFKELRAVQIALGVPDYAVGIDSGHNTSFVYEQCLQHGQLVKVSNGLPEWFGWTPMKGLRPGSEWNDKLTGGKKIWSKEKAALPHSKFILPLIEFDGNAAKDILERLRKGLTSIRWELIEAGGFTPFPGGGKPSDAEYFRQLDSNVKKPVYDKSTNRSFTKWVKRTETWPDHMLDCELEIEILMMRAGLLSMTPDAAPKTDNVSAMLLHKSEQFKG